MNEISFSKKLELSQSDLCRLKIKGWLLYDFRRSNDLACRFLEIPLDRLLTRRFFYWIPAVGTPIKLVHAIEDKSLRHLPGQTESYKTWQELEQKLEKILQNGSFPNKIAMEYSPRNALPALSKVDAGTVDLVRSFGVEVVTSAPLLQTSSVWSEQKWLSHLAAAAVLDKTALETWEFIAEALRSHKALTEYEVQQFILQRFADQNFLTADPPICAVNAHSADPHYSPPKEGSAAIRWGDFILIDLWCRKKGEESVYADITRVAVAAPQPTEIQEKIFSLVRAAQKAATELVASRFQNKQPLMGWEVDQVARNLIQQAGYGEYFIHRTGHNIDRQDHGSGAHIDNFETHDDRLILPHTCFSIEPGIYLPNKFGVRLEYDLFVHGDGSVQITGGQQDSIKTISGEN